MSSAQLRPVDELITELVELVETARAVPMSSSCIIGREQVLDLLDDLRDRIPVELAESRNVLARREALLREADERHRHAGQEADVLGDRIRGEASAEAATTLARARAEAAQLLEQAQEQATQITSAARAEQLRLVAATTVHSSATEQAAALTQQAQTQANRLRWRAESEAGDLLREARRAAAAMRINSAAYADKSLADLLDVLQRVTATTERGRAALRDRLAEASDDAVPAAGAVPGDAEPGDAEPGYAASDAVSVEAAEPDGSTGGSPDMGGVS